MRRAEGFTLVELVAIIVILGVISVAVAAKFGGSTVAQLQAGRDSAVAALFAGQQLAMAQTDKVQVVLSGSQVDVQKDDGGFSSLRMGGVSYPVNLSPVVVDGGPHTVTFDRLGRTTPTTIQLKQGSNSATITISASGFAR